MREVYKWNTRGRKWTALLLAAVLTLLPGLSSYAAGDAARAEAYRSQYTAGLTARYEAYLKSGYGYERLITRADYLHCNWADAVYYQTQGVSLDYYADKGGGTLNKIWSAGRALGHNTAAVCSSAVIWASHFLTDTELNQSAYENYLSRILAMHEKGFLETVQQQAEYDAAHETIDGALEVGWLTLKTAYKLGAVHLSGILGKELSDSLEASLKAYKLTMDGIGIGADIVVSGMDAYALIVYTNMHKERLLFLQAICDHADPKEQKKLIRAAQKLIDVSNIRLAALLSSASPVKARDGVLETVSGAMTLADFTASVGTGKGLDDFIDEFGVFLSENVADFAKKRLKEGGLANGICSGVMLLSSNISLVIAGFEIGGAVGSLFWGDEYERFREMIIMDQIGMALSSAMVSSIEKCSRKAPDQTRYEYIYEMAAIGEALCYVRNRGEYDALQYMAILRKDEEMKWGAVYGEVPLEPLIEMEFPSKEVLEEEYKTRAGIINGCYRALSAIFPAEKARVCVYERSHKELVPVGSQRLLVHIMKPEVTVSGNEEVGEKITNGKELADYYNAIEKDIAEVKRNMLESGITMRAPAWEEMIQVGASKAYATSGALSLRMEESLVPYFSVRPIYYVYTMNFDLATGEPLRLNDILVPDVSGSGVSASRKKLGELLTETLDDFLGDGYAYMNLTPEEIIQKYVLAEPNEKNNEHHWYFTEDGFNVVFNLYEITPYAGGTPVITVPYSKLTNVLKENYFPEDRSDTWTDGRLALAGRTEISDDSAYSGNDGVKIYGNYGSSLHGVVSYGRVYDAYVYYDSNWIIFYANEMTSDDVVWLEDLEAGDFIIDTLYLSWGQTQDTPRQIRDTYEIKNP